MPRLMKQISVALYRPNRNGTNNKDQVCRIIPSGVRLSMTATVYDENESDPSGEPKRAANTH